MTTLPSKEAARGFSDLMGRVRYASERFVVTCRGKPVALVLPMADLALLERPAPEPVKA
ncbi:MAG TPA: type II toxin-antitoxin system Phd/YefM family antitoxin [Myxococcales bacterium]